MCNTIAVTPSGIFSKNVEFDAVFHADFKSETGLVQISFQTRDIQHRTCKKDRFRHPTPLVRAFSLPCSRKSPHEIRHVNRYMPT